jgi:5-methylcytosine-specific restriction enzyme A
LALSLGVRAGDKIFIGDHCLEVKTIQPPTRANHGNVIIVAVDGRLIRVSDQTKTPILPEVHVFSGLGPNGNGSRLAFEAPKHIRIERSPVVQKKLFTKADPPIRQAANGESDGTAALFINGMFEETLEEIQQVQAAAQGTHCYIQPYAARKIKLLATSHATSAKPIHLYISLTKALGLVSYRAQIVGWQDKQELEKDPKAWNLVDKRIRESQLSEGSLYRSGPNGTACVNLIEVKAVGPLENPFPVSCLIKVSDGEPLKKRTRAGGWSPIEKPPEWLGTLPTAVQDDIDRQLELKVAKAMSDGAAARQARLEVAPKHPETIQVISHAFLRNPDVIADVLWRAKGVCERCHRKAPFIRQSNNSPYLEVHHRIQLSDGGEDTVVNAIALCPNCHREVHFGKTDAGLSTKEAD